MPSRAQVQELAKDVLRIKTAKSNNAVLDPTTHGESILSTDTLFVEEEPTLREWFGSLMPSREELLGYPRQLFPFTQWIDRYNLKWLYGDLIAGITVGAVVVPQGMAYAILADLPPQFGLYSSFMGVLLYWFFATSKDITIGPVAVMSQITGNILIEMAKTHPDIPGHVIASALALISGCIIFFIGFIRCGWIVDFISLTSICVYMTGSSLNIIVGQVPTLMGITGFSTRDATYLVFIHILQHLGRSTLDAAMGLTALVLLYGIRYAMNICSHRLPSRQKLFFFLSTLRVVFVILLYTMISWLVNRHHRTNPKFKILGTVPRGFQNAAVPHIDTTIIKAFASNLPATVIVLVIEHISISKSFGRVNNYTINPSQELIAIGFANIIGPFLGAYPATGSFSRTAIKSKAGVRTPFAGVITAVIVLLAIYALPAVFFYIPSATLSAVIIHAVGDLITPPNTVYQFWRVSPFEVVIFFIGVIVIVFSTIEDGIYTSICISAALLLFRVVKSKGHFLGRVKVHSIIDDQIIGDTSASAETTNLYKGANSDTGIGRNVFLPLDHNDGSNPEIELQTPYPGIFIYRFSEGFSFPNANRYLDDLTAHILMATRLTSPNQYPRPGDRPWNDPGPRRGKSVDTEDNRPTLQAIILDFSAVNNIDITSMQALIDVRNQLDRHTYPNKVHWHFAHINNRWTKRALVSVGFGHPTPGSRLAQQWKSIYSVADIGGANPATVAAKAIEFDDNTKDDEIVESGGAPTSAITGESKQHITPTYNVSQLEQPRLRMAAVHGINRPFFHIDLTSALQSAVANAEFHRDLEDKGEPHGDV
ncbi:sulfate permease [Penicillium lagena]|uniref:sulfate permease n=1 Tax=Penicillium lagena TaxID=94218 RepID=UPI002541A94F|nr:sulfate permease [Penicillium lagena]KAJ5624633.1 sulfate permease [Penicillium lagena]